MRRLLRLQWASLAMFCALLLLPGQVVSPTLRDVLLGDLVFLLPAVLMLARGWMVRADRAWAWSLATGMLSYLAGNVTYLVWVQAQPSPPFPSWADLGYVGFYPFAILAVVLSMRARIGRLRASVLLDGLVGGLAAATIGALAVTPLVETFGGGTAQMLVSIAYPAGDVLVITMLVAVLAATGGRPGAFYMFLAAGLVIFAVADVIYEYRLAFDLYETGTPLDALWAIGLAVMAQGAAQRVARTDARPGVGLGSLWIVGLASLLNVAVLAVGSRTHEPFLVVVLATATLVAAAARTTLAFTQVRDLAVVHRLAMTDELTGTANRRALYRRTERALEALGPGEHVGMVLLDLDRFKEVNDSLGHQAGDRLLQLVSDRLSDTLATIDPRLMLARLGGDEFAVLSAHPTTVATMMDIAGRLRSALEEAVLLDDSRTIHVRASAGVALAPLHARDRSDLLRCADMAMYVAKKSGVSSRLFEWELSRVRQDRLDIAEDLHRALREHELTVHYQPQVDLTGVVRAAEALVRWDNPRSGPTAPDDFLGLAEDHQLMPLITRVVLETSLRDCAAWRARAHDVTVSVLLSVSDLHDALLPDRVQGLLAEYGVPAPALTLEITETNVMADPVQAERTLHLLHRLGVVLSVDDYGTGHCSLTYLRRLPVQELKLDRSFVRDMATEPADLAIVGSSVGLAHSLGLRLVAEGVEDAAAARLLVELGCDLAQGWHFARPMPAAGLLAWLERDGTPSTGPLDLAEVTSTLVRPSGP